MYLTDLTRPLPHSGAAKSAFTKDLEEGTCKRVRFFIHILMIHILV